MDKSESTKPQNPAMAFVPPDTMTKDDIRAVADVRRNVWIAGFRGLAWGTISGLAIVFALRKVPLERLGLHLMRSRSHDFVIVMASGALASFWGSYIAGRDSMYLMDPILQRSRYKSMTPYQKSIASDLHGFHEEEEMLRKMEGSHRARLRDMEISRERRNQ